MTPDLLSGVFAIILSLACSYIPRLREKYDAFEPNEKRTVMGIGLILISVSSLGLACVGWGGLFTPAITCDQIGAIVILRTLIMALVANQATFLISPKPAAKG